MVSRIEVIPSEVRGYGNIVMAKSLSDFVPVESDLVYSENVYSLTAVSGVHISLTASSSSINVGSSVTLTATVMEDDTPVTGETVSFYDGGTLLGSDSTDSSGVATYSASALTVGAHSLSAVYDEKTSNSVSVTVNKLASTISLTVPASGTVGTAYTVTGTLVPSTGSVKLYENGSLKDTLTVTGGAFSKSITQSNEGTYSYYAVFEGSSTYESVTSSTGSIVVSDVPTPSFDGISLTGDKNILSAADSEYVTLEAQLTDGGSAAAVSGETVTFTVYKSSDDSVVTTLTDDTDSTGLATVSYYGEGAGDLYIKSNVDSIISSEIYVEDCYYYNSTGITFTSSSTTDRQEPTGIEAFEFTPPTNWQLSYNISDTSNSKRIYLVSKAQSSSGSNRYGLGSDTNNSTHKISMVLRTTSSDIKTVDSSTYPVPVKWEINGNTTKGYVDGVLARTDTITWWNSYAPYYFKWGIWQTGTVTVTNIKVKAL